MKNVVNSLSSAVMITSSFHFMITLSSALLDGQF